MTAPMPAFGIVPRHRNAGVRPGTA